MQNDDNSDKRPEGDDSQSDGRKRLIVSRDLIGPLSLLVVIVGTVVAYYSYFYVSRDSVRIQFWVGFMFSFMALLVVTVQVVIYAQQAAFMREQINVTRIAERGYIGIATIDLVDLVPGLRAHVAVRFLNGGRTPVWHFQAPASLKLGVEPPGDETDSPPRFEPQGEGFLPAGAGTTMRYKFPDETTERRILRIARGERQIFLWGTAYFEDCWGEKRTFPFKMIYNPDDGRFEEDKGYEIW